MKIETDARLLTVYVGEDDKWRSGLLYPAIVDKLQEIGMAGVTVLHGTEGFGSHHRLHTARFEALFSNLPVVIEAVDTPERVTLAIAALEEMVSDGLVTIADLRAIRFIPDPKK
jgi:hypothetical protein